MDSTETAPTPSNEPLLDIDTLITRPRVRIDGALFEIMSPNELGIIDSHRLGAWGRRIQQLAEIEGEPEEAELEELVDRVARKVAVGVPVDVFTKLSGSHKQAIVDVFTGLLLRNRLGVAGAIAKAAGIQMGGVSPTGETSFPGSSDSMAGTRNGGWRKRLSRWFARS